MGNGVEEGTLMGKLNHPSLKKDLDATEAVSKMKSNDRSKTA